MEDSFEMEHSNGATARVDALVTLLVWDAHEAVARLLDSLARGIARKASWRLYILDQGSGTPTCELLRRFADKFDGHVLLDRVSRNIGYPAGHNRLHRLAMKAVEPRYLVTLNSDLVLHEPQWLDGLIDFMDAHPFVGIAGPTGVVYQREPQDRIGWCRVATADETAREQYDSISGSLCILRQSMIDEIGLFDESFTPGYYEDTDLAFRARACGWRLAAQPVSHGHHDLGPEKSTSFIKRDELAALYGNFQKRNRNLFVSRWVVPGNLHLDAERCRALFSKVYFPVPNMAFDFAI